VWTHNVANYLQNLADRRVDVFLAPTGGLRNKVRAINAEHCDLAIEIHFNACGNCGASGCETLYFPGSTKGKAAAEIMQQALVDAMGNRDRGVKEGWYKMDRPGVVDWYGDEDGDEMPDYFLKATNCAALILEPEFIEKIPAKWDLVDDACKAIGEAIIRILQESQS
jgi:hypothetical protein